MGILDTSWEAMRKYFNFFIFIFFYRFLAKSGVKEEIINYDAHRITKDVIKKVEHLVSTKISSFDPKVILADTFKFWAAIKFLDISLRLCYMIKFRFNLLAVFLLSEKN